MLSPVDDQWGMLAEGSRDGARGRQQTALVRALGIQPLVSRTVAEQVHAFIQHALLSGQLNPGDRLAEGELATALGISRTPIREALRQLDNDGLVVVLPHRGTFVRTLDPRRGRQLYETRLRSAPLPPASPTSS
jgi:DNA-binding GntR family transcriptional regulator